MTFPPVDNANNSLVPMGDATRVQHSAIGSGLQLGNAADLDGFAAVIGQRNRSGGMQCAQGKQHAHSRVAYGETEVARCAMQIGAVDEQGQTIAGIKGQF